MWVNVQIFTLSSACYLSSFHSPSPSYVSFLLGWSNAILTAVVNVFHAWSVALNKDHRLRTWRWENAGIPDSQSCRGANISLTLILLTWRIWWASNNASKWQMGFNSAFKGLMRGFTISTPHRTRASLNERVMDRYVTCMGRSPVDTEVHSDNLKGRKLLWRRIRR